MRGGPTPLSEYVATVDVPEAVADSVRLFIADTVAVGVAGGHAQDSPRFHRWASRLSGSADSGATSWARGTRWPVDLAAHLNGIDAHVLDYDDSNGVLRLHPSVVMLPGLLALAEQRGFTLQRVGEAYAVGYEVMAAVASGHLEGHYRRGWHVTTTIGLIGAAAACARLLGLDAAATAVTLGLCGSSVGGSRVSFGTAAKPYQVGAAAAAAVRAALAAEAGVDAGDFIDDPGLGLGPLVTGQEVAPVIPQRGAAWALITNPPKIKTLPTCFATHHAVEAVRSLELAVAPGDIRDVEVVTSATGLVPLIRHLPETPTQARFSMPYVLAAVLRHGTARLSDFTDGGFADRRRDPLITRIHAREADGPAFPRWAEVRIALNSGQALVSRADALPGPGDQTGLEEKIADCLAFANVTSLSAADLVDWVDMNWAHTADKLFHVLGRACGWQAAAVMRAR